MADGNAAMQKSIIKAYTGETQRRNEKLKTIFEQMGGRYIQCGDYLIPDIALPDEKHHPLGKYGLMRMNYLKEHRPSIYNQLILTGKLYVHLGEIEQTCQDRLERIIHQMKETKGITEALKATDQMEWVRRMSSIHIQAEEIVLTELVYR